MQWTRSCIRLLGLEEEQHYDQSNSGRAKNTRKKVGWGLVEIGGGGQEEA
jgi:hypothetical protein